MNIGIDIDDTITNTYETLLPIIAIKYGMNLEKLFEKKYSYKFFYDTLDDYTSFVVNNYSSLAKIVPLKENVVDILDKLRNQGHKIIFITSRNEEEYGNPYQISYDYLKANNVPFDKLLVNVKDKAKECVLQEIDLFIDDNTKHCKAVKNKGISTLQFGTIFTSKIKNINRVESWEDVYNFVQQMYA